MVFGLREQEIKDTRMESVEGDLRERLAASIDERMKEDRQQSSEQVTLVNTTALSTPHQYSP